MQNLFKPTTPFFQKSADSGGDEGDDHTDDGTGDDNIDDAGKKKKVEFNNDQQKEVDRIIAVRLARQEAQFKADAEARDKKAKDEAEQKALIEQGKFKELAEAAEQKAAAEKERADQAIAKADRLELQRTFEATVTELGVKFVSPKASEDAFVHLDLETVGEDRAGMKAAVKKLVEDREYLFEEATTTAPEIDATPKGKLNRGASKDRITQEKRKAYPRL